MDDEDEVRGWVQGACFNLAQFLSMLIRGDTSKNGNLVWEDYNLQPGQNSTQYFCNIDYTASEHVAWQWGWAFIVSAGWWSGYLFNMSVRCVKYTVNGNSSFR